MKYELERWLKERKQPPKLALEDWLRVRQAWRDKQHVSATRINVDGCVVLALNMQRR